VAYSRKPASSRPASSRCPNHRLFPESLHRLQSAKILYSSDIGQPETLARLFVHASGASRTGPYARRFQCLSRRLTGVSPQSSRVSVDLRYVQKEDSLISHGKKVSLAVLV